MLKNSLGILSRSWRDNLNGLYWIHCDGKGKYEGTSNRDIAIALLVSLGVKTNVQVFGDDCLYCEGTGVDLSESLKEVKSKMSSFWVKEIQDIFQTNK
jgi:hypothetical protein